MDYSCYYGYSLEGFTIAENKAIHKAGGVIYSSCILRKGGEKVCKHLQSIAKLCKISINKSMKSICSKKGQSGQLI